MSSQHPLDLTGADLRSLVEKALERLVPWVDSLSEQPMSHGGEISAARELAEDLPETGAPFDELLELIFDRAAPISLNTASGGYLAYVPGGGILHSAVADLIADVVNRYSGVYFAAPGFVQLEMNVIRWFCTMVGYPDSAGGVLTSGGSLANQTAITTARHEKLGEEFLDGTVYVSDQVHHSVLKASVLAGIRPAHVRRLPSDECFRMRLDVLEGLIEEDRAAGLRPFLVVGSGGTTNSGAIDDLPRLAQIARRHDLWFHVDAAYGGFFTLTERGRLALRGLEEADSLILDPHKGLFVPYGTGALLVRDGEALRRTHAVEAAYMPPMQSDPEAVDFCEISPELSRSSRGLRVWLPLRMHGAGVFRDALDEKIDLARFAAEELRRIPGVRLVAEPELSLLAFVLDRPGLDGEELDELNRDLLGRVNRRQRVHLTATRLGGRFTLRICVLSFRTHREIIDACLEDIRAAVAEIDGGGD